MPLEWLLFLLLLCIGVFPFLKRGGSVGTKALIAILFLAGGGLYAATKWSEWQERKNTERAQFYASVPREGRTGGYVSSDKCRSCHPDQYASWHRSYHRTMTQYATPEAVKGKFEGQTLELEGNAYRFERRADEFWVELVDPDWRLDYLANPNSARTQPTRVWRRLGITTGSHHMQAYWVPSKEGNLQLNLPFSFLFDDQRWVPRNDTFLMDPGLPAPVQLWNANCIQCHSTAGQPKPEPKDHSKLHTQLGEIGIACEACHGPANKHVAANSNPARRFTYHRDGKGDPTIINPAELSHVASSHVCGQCHSIKSIPAGSDWKYEGFKYRPGDDLEKFTPVIRPAKSSGQNDTKFLEERYWSDGMVRVSGREYNGLVESPCFQKGTMSCLSCHSMHQGDANDQLIAKTESNAACMQCHKEIKPEHTHHAANSAGSLCYNCHMPHTTYGLMKAIRSHQVDSPSVQATLGSGRPNACNLCHLDKTLAWTAEHLNHWFSAEPPTLSLEQRTTSAAAVWALRGDAGQRALIAWHMGWAPARQASGERWLAPYLGQLLEDPYSTVRYIARRSLRALPGFGDFEFDYIGPTQDRARARVVAWTKWEQMRNPDRHGPEVLISQDGRIEQHAWQRLLGQRDNKSMYLQE